MEQGFIVIYRKIRDCPSYSRGAEHIAVMFEILLRANYSDKYFCGELIKRGSFVCTLRNFGDDLLLNKDKVNKVFKNLIKDGFITKEVRQRKTFITVCNYDCYQLNKSNSCDKVATEKRQASDANKTEKIQTNDDCKTKERLTNKEKEKNKENKDSIDFDSMIVNWNEFAKKYNLATVREINKTRKAKINIRAKENFDFKLILAEIANSNFLQGDNPKNWRVSFDWLIDNDGNFLKVIEGQYRNKDLSTATHNQSQGGFLNNANTH